MQALPVSTTLYSKISYKLHSKQNFITWMLLLLLSCFNRVRLWETHRRQSTRLPHPWDSPGKNTEAGWHFLLQWMKVKGESEVAQSCPTLSDPMDCSLPGYSVHGIFQARVLERVAIAFSHLDVRTPETDGLFLIQQPINSWDILAMVLVSAWSSQWPGNKTYMTHSWRFWCNKTWSGTEELNATSAQVFGWFFQLSFVLQSKHEVTHFPLIT